METKYRTHVRFYISYDIENEFIKSRFDVKMSRFCHMNAGLWAAFHNATKYAVY